MIQRKKLYKLISIAAAFVLCVGMTMAGSQSVDANATGTLKIKVGYYGWSPSEYVEKSTFTDSDIRGMSDGSVKAFSYYDANGKRVAIDSARGASLSGILDAAGIDQGSIAALDFYTSDSGSGAFASFTMQTLMMTSRYYFPDLAGHLNSDGTFANEDAEQELWNSASRVSVILAYEDNWQWYPAGTMGSGPTSSGMNTANRFRLCFGQSNPLDFRTFQSAKQVETIYVMFSGTPKLTVDESNIGGKVGSKHKVKVTAAAADDALLEKIQGQIRYSSSNESVATVDEDGTIHYVGKGTATITITAGGTTTSIQVTVGDEEGGEGDGNGGNGKGNKGKHNSMDDSKKTETKESEKVYILSDAAGKDLQLALMKQAEASEASMGTYQKAMDDDAEQLKLQKEINSMGRAMGASGAIIMTVGGLFGFIRYRKQRWG